MQVSRYSAPMSWHIAIKAALLTFTDRLSRKSPAASRGANGLEVVSGQRAEQAWNAIASCSGHVGVVGADDEHLLPLHVDVPQQERQHALTDAAKTDHQQTAAEFMPFAKGIQSFTPGFLECLTPCNRLP